MSVRVSCVDVVAMVHSDLSGGLDLPSEEVLGDLRALLERPSRPQEIILQEIDSLLTGHRALSRGIESLEAFTQQATRLRDRFAEAMSQLAGVPGGSPAAANPLELPAADYIRMIDVGAKALSSYQELLVDVEDRLRSMAADYPAITLEVLAGVEAGTDQHRGFVEQLRILVSEDPAQQGLMTEGMEGEFAENSIVVTPAVLSLLEDLGVEATVSEPLDVDVLRLVAQLVADEPDEALIHLSDDVHQTTNNQGEAASLAATSLVPVPPSEHPPLSGGEAALAIAEQKGNRRPLDHPLAVRLREVVGNSAAQEEFVLELVAGQRAKALRAELMICIADLKDDEGSEWLGRAAEEFVLQAAGEQPRLFAALLDSHRAFRAAPTQESQGAEDEVMSLILRATRGADTYRSTMLALMTPSPSSGKPDLTEDVLVHCAILSGSSKEQAAYTAGMSLLEHAAKSVAGVAIKLVELHQASKGSSGAVSQKRVDTAAAVLKRVARSYESPSMRTMSAEDLARIRPFGA